MTNWKTKLFDNSIKSILLKKHETPFVREYTKKGNNFKYTAIFNGVRAYQYDVSQDTMLDILKNISEKEFTITIRR